MKRFLLYLLLLPISVLLTSCAENSTHLTSASWVASAAVATVFATIFSSWFNYLLKGLEYRNAYYNKVIDKRIIAIEAAEAFATLFATYFREDDNRVCHKVFYEKGGYVNFLDAVLKMNNNSIWYSIEARDATQLLTSLATTLFKDLNGKNEGEKINMISKSFDDVQSKRIELENIIHNDMASLYKIDDYFKSIVPSKMQPKLSYRIKRILKFR